MIDIYFSEALLVIALVARAAYSVRLASVGRARSARVDAAGNSALLSKTAMEATYWAIGPVVHWLVRMEVTANGVTCASLALGFLAGAAAFADHLGVAAFLAAFSALCDALDGFVARQAGTSSPAGETFDASADRYNEFFLLGGIALGQNGGRVLLGLALLALQGSFMVSYGSARAQGLGVEPPRGSMRRPERAVVLTMGCLLSPLAGSLAANFPQLRAYVGALPLGAALLFVAVGANVSAISRLIRIGQLASDGASDDWRRVSRPSEARRGAAEIQRT